MNKAEVINLILSGVTVAFAGVAIWISISSTNKQNKIALFEKRFQMWLCVQAIFSFAEPVSKLKKLPDDSNSADSFAKSFIGLWCSSRPEANIHYQKFIEAVNQIENGNNNINFASEAIVFAQKLERSMRNEIELLQQGAFLFSKNTSAKIDELINFYHSFFVSMENVGLFAVQDDFFVKKDAFVKFYLQNRSALQKLLSDEIKLN